MRMKMAMAKPPIKALSRITPQRGDSSRSSLRPFIWSQDAMQANPTDEMTRGEVVIAAKPYAINSVEIFEYRLRLVLPLRLQ
jgi:hypothetical protein